jgi:hypothetical protein
LETYWSGVGLGVIITHLSCLPTHHKIGIFQQEQQRFRQIKGRTLTRPEAGILPELALVDEVWVGIDDLIEKIVTEVTDVVQANR